MDTPEEAICTYMKNEITTQEEKVAACWTEVIDASGSGNSIFKISIKLNTDTKSLMIGKLIFIDTIAMSQFNLAFNTVSSA